MLRVPSTLAGDCLSIRLDAGYTRRILFVLDGHGTGGRKKSHPLPKIVAAQERVSRNTRSQPELMKCTERRMTARRIKF
jgi:hypothetical protein